MESAGSGVYRTTATVRVGDEVTAFDIRHGEALALTDASALGTYSGGALAGRTAVSVRTVGRGQAIYLGGVPADAESAIVLYRALLPALPREKTPYSIVKRRGPDGWFGFLLNWRECLCRFAEPVYDEISGTEITELPPYGVAVVKAEA
jgi:hypothetical protein